MSLFHRGTHEMEMIREEHGHTGGDDAGIPGKNVIPVTYYATKITESGSCTYIAKANPGTPESAAKWQVKRIDTSTPGTTITTWAGGTASFNQVATDLTSLTYS